MNDDPNNQTPPPADTGPVRVYDRPEVPPSVVRRRKLTIIMAVIGVLISLLLLFLGPLRSVFSARNAPAWTPPAIQSPVGVITGTATVPATWTPGVDLGAIKETATVAATAIAAGPLPTLAPAATTTPPATATRAPTEPVPTQPPTATVPPTGAPTAVASLPGVISGGRALAFVSDRSGSPQVWVMDATGGNQTQITSQGNNSSPAWSADNRYLYYVGERDGETAVYRLDLTTGAESRVLADPNIVSARPLPGGQLAVVRVENGFYTLYIGDRRLYQLDRAFQFQFSADGQRVLIDPNAAPRVITVVDVATTQAAEVAPANAWNATWGPANRFAYVSDRTGVAGVYVANSDGSNATAVTPGDKWSQAPAFSPDAGRIAFIGGDGPAWNLYVVATTGGQAQRVGGPANPGKSPLWQPTGQLIAYESDRTGNWDIYVTDPQGNERNLTNAPGNDTDPAWTW